jgi:hypothetical protein
MGSSCQSSTESDNGRFVPALTSSQENEQAQPQAGTSLPARFDQTCEESSLAKAVALQQQSLKPVETLVRLANGARFVEQTSAVLVADGILPPCATSNSCSVASDATKGFLRSAFNPDTASNFETRPVQLNTDLPHEIEVATNWADLLDPNSGPRRCRQPDKREVYLIENVFSIAECKALIASSEEHGYGATNYPKSYRGNLRLITKDASLTGIMWQRLRPFVPATVTCGGSVWEAVGLNECWRLAKYHPGDRFMRHLDAAFKRDQKEMSMFTVNIYMNGDFEGGATRFYPDGNSPDPNLVVSPEAGLCLLFRQPPSQQYYHDGERVRQGNKYLFRTDVIYHLQDDHC